MRLDSHQHFWRYTPAEYAWIDARMARIARDFALGGEPPDPANLPSGCRFRTRCPKAQPGCAAAEPTLAAAGGTRAACFHPG